MSNSVCLFGTAIWSLEHFPSKGQIVVVVSVTTTGI